MCPPRSVVLAVTYPAMETHGHRQKWDRGSGHLSGPAREKQTSKRSECDCCQHVVKKFPETVTSRLESHLETLAGWDSSGVCFLDCPAVLHHCLHAVETGNRKDVRGCQGNHERRVLLC